MHALNPTFERFQTAHVPAGAWTKGNAARFEIARMGEIERNAGKYKNRGNKAKEYLKTKDITFSDGANCARFKRQLAAI
jgi:hypothetical protein